jgi:hypothetical protein
MRRPAGNDEGTILLLTVGLSVVLLLLVVVVVDVSVVVLARRGVASAADGAAVAAAQQADATVLDDPDRNDLLTSRLPLDPELVAQVVARYQDDAAASQRSLTLVPSVEGSASSEAVVQAERTVRLPFLSWFGITEVEVRATGRARSPVAP